MLPARACTYARQECKSRQRPSHVAVPNALPTHCNALNKWFSILVRTEKIRPQSK